MHFRRSVALMAMSLLVAMPPYATGQELPGVSETEIRIGNTNPYTGPASSFGTIGRTLSAFFDMINDNGGINGRQITYISYDDSYSPPRTLEQARRLVEADDVLLVFQSLGTGPNLAIRDYLNDAGVPQLFVGSGATFFDDPQNFPWTMPFTPSYRAEATVIANYILNAFPEAVVGVLYQDDDFGRDYLAAIYAAFAGRLRVVSQPYAVGDATVDSQIIALRDAGASVLVSAASIRSAAQAIRRTAEIGWSPNHFVASVSSGIEDTLTPAGLDNAVGVMTTRYLMDPADPAFSSDPEMLEFLSFFERYDPGTGEPGAVEVYAYAAAWALVEVLRRCGDDLSRGNVIRQAAGLVDVDLPLLLPGVLVETSSNDYSPIEQLRLSRFDGQSYVLLDH